MLIKFHGIAGLRSDQHVYYLQYCMGCEWHVM
jgi:hypothetical protein